MAAEIKTIEPDEVVAGDLIQWKIADFDDYPISDSWVLSYKLVSKDGSHLITCSDNGDGYHLASISAENSADITAGYYRWQAYVTKATERYLVREGGITFKPNFADLSGGYDARSYWRTVMDNVQAVIEDRATKDQSSYTVNGRQLSRTPIADLLKLYNRAKTEVESEEKAEKIAKGLGVKKSNVLLRFNK